LRSRSQPLALANSTWLLRWQRREEGCTRAHQRCHKLEERDHAEDDTVVGVEGEAAGEPQKEQRVEDDEQRPEGHAGREVAAADQAAAAAHAATARPAPLPRELCAQQALVQRVGLVLHPRTREQNEAGAREGEGEGRPEAEAEDE
jgi:hypothetical protein